MRWIKKDESGKVVMASDGKFDETFELAEEDYDVGFDGVIYSKTELNGEEYQRRKTEFDKANSNFELSQKYIPSKESSLATFAKAYLKNNPPQSTVEKLEYSGLYDEWVLGSYSAGDIRNYAGQTWECWTDHDNAIYPDITPDNPQTWANFWRPLHGTSIDTARPWSKPWTGTTDMYHTGEYMIYTGDKTYKCIQDTVYSPEEYAQAWQLIE